MPKWNIYTPDGMQDILFEECYAKRILEEKIRNIFRQFGFYEIETPTLEFYDVFSLGDRNPHENMFKFFDYRGRILALRPDLTIPVARIAASKLKNNPYPIKVSYIGNTFKNNEPTGSKQRELPTAGIEILGVTTPEADAEVIFTAINAIKASGLEDFQIDLGEANFFKGLMEDTELTDHDIENLRIAIDRKDFHGVKELVESYNIKNDISKLLLKLPGYFGSIDIIKDVKKITSNERSLKALENLENILNILDDYGVTKYVSIDLGMVKNLEYYTGVIFKGFTYGVGFPILSGGRYDNLIETFGKKCPATGAALFIDMIMSALNRQKIELPEPYIDFLITYNKNFRKSAIKICSDLRNQGKIVEMNVSNGDIKSLKINAKSRNIKFILSIDSENKPVIYDVQKETILTKDFNNIINII